MTPSQINHAIELEPKYVEIANKRLQEALSQTKLMEGLT
jgi:DNA modification methylase